MYLDDVEFATGLIPDREGEYVARALVSFHLKEEILKHLANFARQS